MRQRRASVGQVIGIVPSDERLALGGLLAVTLCVALFETLGVVSILPFMALVMDPSVVHRSHMATWALTAVGVTTDRGALIAIGIAVVAILLIGNAASAAGQWMQQRFLARVQGKLMSELYAGYMTQPYAFHLGRDSAALMKVVFSDVGSVISNAIGPLITATTRGFVVVGLLGLLMLREPVVALGTLVVLGGAYSGMYWVVRASQRRLGQKLTAESEILQRTALEGIGGIKELVVLGRERDSIDRFESATTRLLGTLASNNLTAILPRYLLETIALGGIVFVTLTLIRNGTSQSTIPTLALYAFVGYRLMPALQQVFASAVTLRFAGASLEAVESDLMLLRRSTEDGAVEHDSPEAVDVDPAHDVKLDHVTFTYPEANRPALSDISLTVRPNETIGLVGRTGAGKTTLADLLLGLYEPTTGTVAIGGVPLCRATLRSWRRTIGYVPQTVFLANATVAQNIAFGLAQDHIDRAAVVRAAGMAQADEFIAALPRGLDTLIGERGVKLSGGQRQRLGIARALYHDPHVLVFDEATSALDGLTEESVMQAIQTLSTDRTIILIAHRMRTIEACERIVVLENGRIVADGGYRNLLETSAEFRRLVGQTARSATMAFP